MYYFWIIYAKEKRGCALETKRGKLVLITGGARSGKSTFAEKYALESNKRVIFIATAAADDEEMKQRIRMHQEKRPPHFITVEEKYFPGRVIEKMQEKNTLFLLDCLTLLLSNHLLKAVDQETETHQEPAAWQKAADKTLDYISTLSRVMQKSPSDVIVVTNEVGSGLVPEHYLGRLYRDMAGRANQIVAAAADEVWLTVCGLAQKIK